jgi:hypothetical protein
MSRTYFWVLLETATKLLWVLGSVVDPHWIWILIRIGNAEPDQDPRAWKLTKIYKKPGFLPFSKACPPSYACFFLSITYFKGIDRSFRRGGQE